MRNETAREESRSTRGGRATQRSKTAIMGQSGGEWLVEVRLHEPAQIIPRHRKRKRTRHSAPG